MARKKREEKQMHDADVKKAEHGEAGVQKPRFASHEKQLGRDAVALPKAAPKHPKRQLEKPRMEEKRPLQKKQKGGPRQRPSEKSLLHQPEKHVDHGQDKPHLPLHEQIKKQLSEKRGNAVEQKKGEGAGGHGKREAQELKPKKADDLKLEAEGEKARPPDQKPAEAQMQKDAEKPSKVPEKSGAKKDGPAFKPAIGEDGKALTHFDITMMERMEMTEKGAEVEIRLTGSLGLDKALSVQKKEVAGILRFALPKKINMMEPGEGVVISGMDMDELEELFKASIPVEPKGELEVSESEDNGKVSLEIRVSGKTKKPLFNYAKPGIEDVRRLVERQKLAILASQKPQEGQKTAPKEDDWLSQQINSQARDVATIAKELGELVKPAPQAAADELAQPEEEAPAGQPKRDSAPVQLQAEPAAQAPAVAQSPAAAPPQPEVNAPSASVFGAGGPQTAPQAATTAQKGEDSADMAEFMDAYKEEAVAYVEALKKLPQVKDNPQNADLISELHRSAHGLKSMSAAMGFSNISKISKALEMLFASYKKAGLADMEKYGIAKEGVDRIESLYGDLANSEKADVKEVVEKIESVTPS